MLKIWKIDKVVVFKQIEENSFVIIFVDYKDRDKVLEGKSWLFYNNLFVLNYLMDPTADSI